MPCRSYGTKARIPRCRAQRSPPGSRKASIPTTGWSATRAATSKPDSMVPPRSSKRSTPIPISIMSRMEPQNATVLYTADKCEVWCSTQNGEAALATAAEASGLPVPKCEVYKTFLGGGFGRRGDVARLHSSGGPHRQGNAGHSRQDAVDPRRGHDPRLVPSGHAMQDHGRPRQGQQPHRDSTTGSRASRSWRA